MYDFPLPASTSLPPSPHKSHKPRRRSQSPLPGLSTLLPTHHSYHDYSPSTRASDVSRLLDPAYASSSSSSSASPSTPESQTQTRAYVDHNGDFHDPDYRDFPIIRPPSRNNNVSKRRRSSGSATRSPSRERYAMTLSPPRPSWERDWTQEVDESDAEDDDEAESQSHFSHFASPQSSPRKHASSAVRSSYTSTYYYFPDAAPTSSPSGSLEDENALQLHESPFGDNAAELVEEPKRCAVLVRQRSKPKKTSGVEMQTEKAAESAPSLHTVDEVTEDDEHATTPTCSLALRRQWQAVSVRVRFGVFHAKRRLLKRHTT
ncbi:uncharacterized protein BXZ73DRAFT_47230 [Epithele typhae]|uniref:uncharacterized protein n=1 Tax=Epithele typhae TaxID=378194 RepID=UPI002007E7CA|nr:uncharacterized protein BXZ73DRAFT_47230 [Epithele typhae]KAH9931722.1 hypothetical protein BXZ73DRAFT_47230 [Epithele typhae]